MIERRADLVEYERACGRPVSVVRLVATAETIEQRLRMRRQESSDALAWHLARRAELDSILDAARVADADVVIGERAPDEIAAQALQLLGW